MSSRTEISRFDDLKQHHIFIVNGQRFLFNAEDMLYMRIPATVAHELAEGTLSTEGAGYCREAVLLKGDTLPPEPPVFSFAPPSTLVLMLTYACNMDCRYCRQGEIPDIGDNEMSEAVAKQAIDWFLTRCGRERADIGFFGGEPLLKFSLMKELVAYASEKAAAQNLRIGFGLMTNGLALNEEVCRFFSQHRFEVSISFDGPAAVQDYNRPLKNGGPSHVVIEPKIRRLLQACPETKVRATVYPGTDLAGVYAEMRRIGFAACRVDKVSNSLLTQDERNDEKASVDDMIAYMESTAHDYLAAIKRRQAEKMQEIAFDDNFCEALRAALAAGDIFNLRRRRYFTCGTGRGLLTVAINGDVYACPRFLATPEYKLGSIYEPEIDNTEYRKSLPLHGEDCRKCWARFVCGGGCVVEHMGATGSMFRANGQTCRLRKRRLELGVFLACSLDRQDLAYLKQYGIV